MASLQGLHKKDINPADLPYEKNQNSHKIDDLLNKIRQNDKANKSPPTANLSTTLLRDRMTLRNMLLERHNQSTFLFRVNLYNSHNKPGAQMAKLFKPPPN